ncbi:MAG: CHAT domain-containing protein [Cytophagaceae bacterium]|jgi:CHAT domain-containing protein/Tfp pilus assembly protein PilF|nr:CHAT domain-containing protein [Cytophagaceae bacterium]
MKKTALLALPFLIFSQLLWSQIPKLPKISNPLSGNGVLKNTLSDTPKDIIQSKMAKAKAEFDSTSFNYAVSLSDNAGLFENEERWLQNQKMISDLFKDKNEKTELEKISQHNDLGEMLYASNKFGQAEKEFKKALQLTLDQNYTEQRIYDKLLANLGLLYHTKGSYHEAERYTLQALNIRKALGANSIGYSASVNNLGVLYKDQGKFDEAEKNLMESMRLNAENPGKKSAGYAIALNNLAMLYAEMGRFEQADKTLQESISIASEVLTEKSTNYQRLLINQALLYKELKQYEKADEVYKKAIKIKERKLGTGHPDYAHLLNLQAELYWEMGKLNEVENLLKKAAEIYEKKFTAEHPSYAAVIHNLGDFYREQGKLPQAETPLKKALEIRLKLLGGNHADVLANKESLALLAWQQGNFAQANTLFNEVLEQDMNQIQSFFAPLSEAEKGKFWSKMAPHFQHYASFVVEQYRQNPDWVGQLYNYQLSTKALLLNAGNKIRTQILSSGDAKLIDEYTSWLDNKESIARYYLLSKAELKEQGINLDSLEIAVNAKEKKLSEKSNLFRSGYKFNEITWQNIQQSLTASDATIELVTVPQYRAQGSDSIFYAAILLQKEWKKPELVVLKNGNQLEKKYFSYYKNCIRSKVKDEYSYLQFWKPIDDKIGNKVSIFVSLDGIYNQINLNTLQLEDGTYLVDKRNITLVSNTKEVVRLKTLITKSVAKTAVLIGNPAFGKDGSVSTLPGTKTEIETIKKNLSSNQFNVNVLTNADASEINVKKIKNPQILHIATHGFFLKETKSEGKNMGIHTEHLKTNPLLRSGILLSDAEAAIKGDSEHGILTAYEVMNLSLDHTEIAIISACETGLGEVKNGEGVYGLQRAFLVAGVDALMMSLWKVNDETTQKLMTSFYKFYLSNADKQKAFKAAMAELKAQYKDPYYWGAFVLIQ